MSSRKIALLSLFVASIFWASAGVAAKTLLRSFDPITVGALRLTMASLVILPFFLKVTPKISKKMILDILPVSLFSAGNFLFYLFGINRTTANASAIIYTVTPISVAVLSGIFIGEKISRQKTTGILLGLSGVLTILLLPIVENGHAIAGDVIGNVIIFGAMLMFALYNVGTRRLISIKSYHPFTIIGASLFVSALCFLCLFFLFPHAPLTPSIFVPVNFLTTFYLATFVTVLPYVLHQWAIKHSSATTGALTTYIQPVFGFVFNGILLGEMITGGFLVGSFLVFAGTFVATGAQTSRFIRTYIAKRRS
jgi:drug/metabolite transporter (DMT)-like permease